MLRKIVLQCSIIDNPLDFDVSLILGLDEVLSVGLNLSLCLLEVAINKEVKGLKACS